MLKKIPVIFVLVLVIIFAMTACGSAPVPVAQPTMSDVLKAESNKAAAQQQTLMTTQPAPTIKYSNERANLIKRAEIFNDPNKVSWIYLLTENGQIVDFTSVKGKVSNLSSYLVPDTQIVSDPYFYTYGSEGRVASIRGIPVQAPDIDGSYGTNGTGGVFWFDTEGHYHEWNGLYRLSEVPVKLNVQPVMVSVKAGGQ